jgi:hypothetical protein
MTIFLPPPNEYSDVMKIVQFYVDGVPVLAGGESHLDHAEIFREKLGQLEVPFKDAHLPGFPAFMEKNGPAVNDGEGGRYRLVGTGRCGCMETLLVFGTDSMGYKMGINRKHLEECEPDFEKLGLRWAMSE